MGPRVDHRIWDVIVGKIGISGSAVERELQHFHAWETELLTQCDDVRRDESEIFNDERELAQCALHGLENDAPWTLLPVSGRRGGGIGRYDPGCSEGAEMVDSEQVNLPQRGPDAIDPPGVAGLSAAF